MLLGLGLAGSARPVDTTRWAMPLDDVSRLSANFGEMRPGHFHSGLDIKTGGVTGRRVYAVDDGYISRIGIKPGGYGRVLYVTHRDGMVSVYGHLESFTPEVERYVSQQRYKRQIHDVDLFPSAGRFPVRRGEEIARSGNSGMSFGPHLHFEIREAGTQRPLNLTRRGILRVADSRPPEVVKLYYYRVDTVGGVPVHRRQIVRSVRAVGPGEYVTADPRPLKLAGPGYFAVEVVDRKDGTNNRYGIWRLTGRIDDEPYFEFRLDAFAFSQTKYSDAVSVYPLQRRSRNNVFRLAVAECNRMPGYGNVRRRGLIVPDCRRQAVIEAEDDSGNVTRLRFAFEPMSTPGVPPEAPAGASRIVPGKERSLQCEGGTVTLPADAFFEPVFFRFAPVDATPCPTTVRVLSPVYEVGDPDIPLFRAMTLALRVEVPDTLRSRAVLAAVDAEGRLAWAGGRWREGAVTGTLGRMGRYCVVADTTPPTIACGVRDGADLSQTEGITFTLRDDFSGIARFAGTIDGAWIPFERDLLRKTITHRFDEHTVRGRQHRLELRVTDGAGNTQVLHMDFYR